MQGAGVSGGERGAAREQRTVLKADVARLKAEVVLRGIALQRAPHVGGAAEGQLRVAWRGHRRRAETRQEVVHHFRARLPRLRSRRTAQPASPKRHRGFALGSSSTARMRATCGLTAPSAAALGAPASSSSNSCSSTGTGDPPPRRCSSLRISSSDPPEESPPVPPSSATRHMAMCFWYAPFRVGKRPLQRGQRSGMAHS